MQPVTRIAVTVTFLRMDRPPADPARPLPSDVALLRLPRPSVPFYRYLYGTVGAPHVWWLRRTLPDPVLAGILADPDLALHVLYRDCEPIGFAEIDARNRPTVNLSYFGLVPTATGVGLGTSFLRAAIDAAWGMGARGVTVNTCTADHPRALPSYLRAGFRPVRAVREIWDVPTRLGLVIPDHLRLAPAAPPVL